MWVLPGPDAGKGGKFLILPQGRAGEVLEGHDVDRSGTNNVFIFLRSLDMAGAFAVSSAGA